MEAQELLGAALLGGVHHELNLSVSLAMAPVMVVAFGSHRGVIDAGGRRTDIVRRQGSIEVYVVAQALPVGTEIVVGSPIRKPQRLWK
jgi:hypothetical protein